MQTAEHIEQLYDGLRAVDALVFKALDVKQQAQSAAIETRLRRFITAQWNTLARQAVSSATNVIRNGPGDVVRAGDVNRALDVIDRTMAQWAGRVGERFVDDVHEVYGLGRKSGLDRATGASEQELEYSTPKVEVEKYTPKKPMIATIKPSFDLVDEHALEALEDHQLFWIGHHYEGNVAPSIAGSVKASISAGMGREEAGKLMRAITADELGKVSVPGGFHGTAASYFEGLAANAATVARTTGHLRSFQKIGHTKYTVVNPGDHRTCETCNLLDGKEFYVKDGVSLVGKVAGATNPLSVKNIQPYMTPAKAQQLTGGKAGPAPPSATKGLVKSGNSMPPFHYKCRCDIDITADEQIIPFETDIGGGPKVATPKFNPASVVPKAKQLKPKKVVPKPTPKPKAVPQVQKPPPPTPPPPAEESIAAYPAEFPWEARQLKRMNKTFNGAHRKWAYEAPDGSQWLFKPTSEEFRAYGDEVAARISAATGVPTPAVHVVKMDGQVGSIQRLYLDVQNDLKAGGGVAIESLTAKQVGAVQREHAFDWLIGNHDGHGGNLLLRRNGEVSGIDKGQLFKFYGKDSLARTYNPNQRFGEVSYYNQQFTRYADGKAGAAFQLTAKDPALVKFLDAVEAMPEEDFIAMIRPYSSRAVKARRGVFGKIGEKKFLDMALKRKRELRQTINAYYDDLEKARKQALGVVEEVAEAAPGKAVTPINARFVKEARDSKWAGRSLYVGGEDFEGMNFLTYGTDKRTILETKLRAAGNDKFLAFARQQVGTSVEMADEQWDQVLKYVKSINYHLGPAGDGKLPAATEQLGKALAEQYFKTGEGLVTGSKLKAFQHYKKELKKVLTPTGQVKKAGLGKKIGQYKPKAEKPKGVPAGAPKVTRVSTFDEGAKKFRAGEIFEEAGTGNQFHGEVYEVDFGKGIKAVYVRHGDGNKFSKQGKFRIIIDKDIKKVSPKDIENAIKQMEKIGLGTKLADPQDLELLYLIKVTRAAGLEGTAAYMPDPGKSVAQNIKKIKGAWEKRLKKKLTKATGYEPLPEGEFMDGSGWGRWKRFDIDVKKLIEDDVGVYHRLYGGTKDVDIILKGGSRSLISTEEKYRMGVVPKGMSPGQDQETGGAAFVFTRLRTTSKAGGQIRFHPEVLRDPDAIVYRGDMFGKVHESTIQANRQYGQAKMTSIAKTGASNNETIFKHTLSLEKWMDEMKVGSAAEKKRVIAAFKEAGITHVGPNRKPIEQAIVTKRTKLK